MAINLNATAGRSKTDSYGSQATPVLVNEDVPVGAFFQAVHGTALASSTAETSLLTGTTKYGLTPTVGTIPASAMNVLGKWLRFTARGVIGDTGTPNLTLKVYLGSTAVFTVGPSALVAITGSGSWVFTGDLYVASTGATGTVNGHGKLIYSQTTLLGTVLDAPNAAAITVDLTAAQAIDVKATWGTSSASNTIALTTLLVERIA